MITEEFSFPSKDGKTTIHAIKWMNDEKQYRAILQVTHGMIEYIELAAKFISIRKIKKNIPMEFSVGFERILE